MRQSGVYRIRNTVNDKCYYGSTVDWKVRKIRHLGELRKGIHHCEHLQRAWNKYGAEAFVFEWIEDAEKDRLFEREQFYLDANEDKYNTGKYAGMAFLGRKHSEESRKKMSLATKGQTVSQERREHLSRINTGKKYSDEVKAKVSRAMTGRYISPETAKKNRKNGYSHCSRSGAFIVRLYANKTCILGGACDSEENAKKVVALAREQYDSGKQIDIPGDLFRIRHSRSKWTGKGYCFSKHAKRYIVYRMVRGKNRFYGRFKSEQEAIERVAALRRGVLFV